MYKDDLIYSRPGGAHHVAVGADDALIDVPRWERRNAASLVGIISLETAPRVEGRYADPLLLAASQTSHQ